MSQKTIVTLTHDIDGSEAAETVSFGLRGTTYEIDLNSVHAEELDELLAPYISVARTSGSAPRSTGQAKRSTPKQRSSDEVDTKAVRAWAEANDIQVSARGRISADVVKRYKDAQA